MPEKPPSTDPLELATIGADGKPPEMRLSSAKQAHEIFSHLKDAAQTRLSQASVIQGMFDGNRPYNSVKMRNLGQGWRPNFSTLEGAARKDSAKTPYYDLFSSASMYAMASTRVSEEGKVDAQSAGMIRSEEFHGTLKAWKGFNVQIWKMLDDMIAFNKGFLWFPRPESWRFKHIRWDRVYFPDGTSIDHEDWELFCIEHEWPVHTLYGFIKDEKMARKAGWNPDAIVKAIKRAVPKNIGTRFNDPMTMQMAMRDSELYTSVMSSTVQAASVYVREFSGKWTRLMVEIDNDRKRSSDPNRPMSPVEAAQHQQGSDDDTKMGDGDWLYKKKEVADSVIQIICPFIYEPGNGSINSIEGLGKRLISIMQAKDRMRCEQVMNTFLRSSIVLQAKTGGARSKTGLIQHGPITVIPEGYDVQQGSILGDIESTLAVNSDLDRMLDVNTGTYRPQFEKPTGNPESATAANIRFSQATVLTNSAVNRFYEQLDPFYEEVYRRMSMELPDISDGGVKSAKEFQKRCKDRGLTDKQIRDIQPGAIMAVRTIGNGSPVMRQQTMQAVGSLVPFLGPRGLHNWKVAFASAFGGQQLVELLLPEDDIQQKPTQDDYDATGENADFQTGAPALFMEEQNHEVHAKVHLTAGVGAVQSVQQGGDVGMAITFLQTMLPHVAQHIGRVPRENIKRDLAQTFQLLQQQVQKIIQMAKQRAQQSQQQAGMSAEAQAKMMEMQAKLQLEAQKMQVDAKLKEAELQHDITLDNRRFEHEQTLAKKKVDADIQTQKTTASAQIQIDQQKAAVQNRLAAQKAAQKPKGASNE